MRTRVVSRALERNPAETCVEHLLAPHPGVLDGNNLLVRIRLVEQRHPVGTDTPFERALAPRRRMRLEEGERLRLESLEGQVGGDAVVWSALPFDVNHQRSDLHME